MQIRSINNANFVHQFRFSTHLSSANSINFSGTDTITLNRPSVAYKKENKINQLKNRYIEIKKYNPTKSALFRAMALDDTNYAKLVEILNTSLNRKINPTDKEPGFDLSYSKDNYNGVIEERMNLGFTNTFGYYSSLNTTSESGALNVKRATYEKDGRRTSELIDKTAFNPNYQIENKFKEAQIRTAESMQEGATKEISISNKDKQKILNYSYTRKTDSNSDNISYNINGKKYTVKVQDNGKIIITSGDKGRLVDLSDKIKEFNKGRETLIEALKILPPQILFGLDENFSKILPTTSKSYYQRQTMYVNTYDPYLAAKSIMDSTIERLSRRPKLKTNKQPKGSTRKNSLLQDKKLNSIFKKEQIEFLHWLFAQSDGRLIKEKSSYIKNIPVENELMETVKAISDMLWTQEYEENKTDDESKRILLNFFPETVSYVVSQFELNAV